MSGRPRMPLSKAEITGAHIKNPQRFRDRTEPEPAGVLGDPPAAMTDAQADCWRQFAGELPWLNAGHRALVHGGSVLRARLQEPDCPVSAIAALSVILSKLGATPADASRVSMPAEKDDDPFAKYFG